MALDFNLVTEFDTIKRRGFDLVDPTIIDPNNANPLVLGEWLELDPADTYKLYRGTSGAAGTTKPAYPVFSERGRTDTQAIGKTSVLWLGQFEADSKIFTGAFAIGDKLMVADCLIGALTKRGLKVHGGGAEFVAGYVTRLPASNKGYLRFQRTW